MSCHPAAQATIDRIKLNSMDGRGLTEAVYYQVGALSAQLDILCRLFPDVAEYLGTNFPKVDINP